MYSTTVPPWATISYRSRIAAWHCSLTALLVVAYPAIAPAADDPAPRIVNIINFIRLLEPRSADITQERLFQTVVNQAELMTEHRLPGTFLLQYDALMDARYQVLLKKLPSDQFEIGGWWEIPQPLVEKAGLKWRGRYPWDWHADVGFASGYTPRERERLVDVYMADFKAVFGDYPKSMASWFIDAHTLAYMHDKYEVIASANCKDQVGTDGYTLWGGYWNQAYYPSRLNAYMPAQHADRQIPIPVFRMLGSDPLRQYDTGIGAGAQGVISLEPVYGDSGGDPQWTEWFLKNLAEGECLAFNYAQAGQENSFTWQAMQRGLRHQFPLIAKLRDEGKLRVETLAASGEWFRQQFPTTPATAMSFQTPLRDDNRQTVWYNSRFYRANLIWEQDQLRLRDIHLFDERVESPILRSRVAGPAVEFHTLPVVDGYYWSSREQTAGLLVKAIVADQEIPLTGSAPTVAKTQRGGLEVSWKLSSMPGLLLFTFEEDSLRIELVGSEDEDWWLELAAGDRMKLPFTSVSEHTLQGKFKGIDYQVRARQGGFHPHGAGYRILPAQGAIALQFGD